MNDSRKRRKIRIGDLLVQHKKISEQQLEEALKEQKRTGHKLGRTLVQLGHISEEEFLEFLAHQLDVPRVDLKHFKFKSDVVQKLSEKHARRFRALVLNERGDELLVGMADPTDLFAYDELRRLLKRPLKVALVRESDLVQAIDTMYRRTEEISTLAEEVAEDIGDEGYDLAELDEEASEDDAPVIRLLRSMFEDAVQINASDIHIEPGEKNLLIRQRVDGELQEQVIEGRKVASALVTRLKLMASLNISEKRLPQDGRFSIRVKDRALDVRMSTMPIQYGESVVMRLLDQSAGQLSFDGLGMPDDLLGRIKNLVMRDSGMVVVTGPTGSGKTTTLYAALNTINRPERKIITVEDPVEYRLPRINQVQVNSRIGLDFARVLRTALRQDPDIVMIGEMRDAETAEIGLRAAMTGHLVLSTLHTNNAVDSVVRLMDMGAEGYMIATSVTAVIAQRLVRRVCDGCGEAVEPTRQERAWLSKFLDEETIETTEFVKGAGCTYCGNTGYRGRIGVYELLELDDELADLLRQEDSAGFARAARQRDDYRPLLSSAVEHMKAGITSIEDVLRLAGGLDAITDEDDGELPEVHLEEQTADHGKPDPGEDAGHAANGNGGHGGGDGGVPSSPGKKDESVETPDAAADGSGRDSQSGLDAGTEPGAEGRSAAGETDETEQTAEADADGDPRRPASREARDSSASLMEFASTRRRRSEDDDAPRRSGSSDRSAESGGQAADASDENPPAGDEEVSFTDFEGELTLAKSAGARSERRDDGGSEDEDGGESS
ncbi:MAG: ATPase, T2SS/T4P/T4SS family [Candidatus Wenzhouxiangella sp. M2_3B_020]